MVRKHQQQRRSSNNSGNIVKKLEQLRAFCGSEWNETDLCACLRQCGYNVQLAAEKLITGQFATSSLSSLSSSRDSMFTKLTTTTTTTTTSATPTTNIASTSKKAAATTARTSTERSSHHESSSGTSTPVPVITPKVRKHNSSHKRALSSSKKREEDSDGVVMSSSSSSHKRQRRPLVPAVTPRQADHCYKNDNNDATTTMDDNDDDEMFVLCQRWLTCTCMSKYGRMDYKETVLIEASSSGAPLIRFRGTKHNLEGTLPRTLSAILTPIFRFQQQQTQTETILSIQAHALMTQTNIPLGGEVPIELSVSIHRPRVFFDVCFRNDQPNKDSAATLFFQTNNKSTTTTKQNYYYNKNKLLPLSEAAFALLQWAEYGQLPEFQQKTTTNNNNNTKTAAAATTTQPEETEQDNDTASATALKSLLLSSASLDNDNSANNHDTKKSQLLPEMDDPVGFQDFNIQLRPYQRQALYWMIQREQPNHNTHEYNRELEKQLALLSELLTTTTRKNQSTSHNKDNDNDDFSIRCDCGPVVVSRKASQLSKHILEDTATTSTTTTTLIKEQQPTQHHHHHPLWQRRYLALPQMNETISFYVNELLHLATCKIPQPPQQCLGGILADSMGLGKTVMLLALIMKSKELQETTQDDSTTSTKNNNKQPTLVVAPLSLLSQWEEELETKTSLSYYIHYHGGTGDNNNNNNSVSSRDFCGLDKKNVDVVVTTYGTVQGEYQKLIAVQQQQSNNRPKNKHRNAKTPFVLNNTKWFRIILDEAHTIKNHATIISKACCHLQSKHRWCITGTIIQNSLDDVYSLLKFLRHEPWCEHNFWKIAVSSLLSSSSQQQQENQQQQTPGSTAAAITNGMKNNQNSGEALITSPDSMSIAIDRIKRVLSPMMLRRTKDTLAKDGKPILVLPPIETKVISVTFTPLEKEFYNALLLKSQDVFEGLIRKGTANKSWFTIFSLLHRLRQACDHITLTVAKMKEDSDATRDVDDDNDNDNDALHKDNSTHKNKKKKKDSPHERKNNNELLVSEVATASTTEEATMKEDNTDEGIDTNFLQELLDKFCSGQQQEKEQELLLQEKERHHSSDEVASISPSAVGKKSPSTATEPPPAAAAATTTTLTQAYSSTVAHSLNDLITRNASATHIEEECPICLEFPKINEAVIAPLCAHIFCKDCLVGYLKQSNDLASPSNSTCTSSSSHDGACPMCNAKIEYSKIIVLLSNNNKNNEQKAMNSSPLCSTIETAEVDDGDDVVDKGDDHSRSNDNTISFTQANTRFTTAYLTDISSNKENNIEDNQKARSNVNTRHGNINNKNGRVTARGITTRISDTTNSTTATSSTLPLFTSTRSARKVLHNALTNRTGSSKLSAILNELYDVWKLDPGSKVLIFSQFLGFLDIIEGTLEDNNIPHYRLDGKLSIKERIKVLENFKKQSDSDSDKVDDGEVPENGGSGCNNSNTVGSVLLISMKAGGVGLNLVAASSVFIVDPWWNASVEDQCINRIHRIGQTANLVRVRKFIVSDTVEERIVELQHKKKNMANEILCDETNNSDDNNNTNNNNSNRPTLDDFRLIFGR